MFVPVFLIVNFTATRAPCGIVVVATNESVDVDVRYPVAIMCTTKFGRPWKICECAGVEILFIW